MNDHMSRFDCSLDETFSIQLDEAKQCLCHTLHVCLLACANVHLQALLPLWAKKMYKVPVLPVAFSSVSK